MALNKHDADTINNLILRVNDLTAQVEQINTVSRAWIHRWPFHKMLGLLPDFPMPTMWRPLQLVVDSTPKRDEEWDDARRTIDFRKGVFERDSGKRPKRQAGFQFPTNTGRGEFTQPTSDSMESDDNPA